MIKNILAITKARDAVWLVVVLALLFLAVICTAQAHVASVDLHELVSVGWHGRFW